MPLIPQGNDSERRIQASAMPLMGQGSVDSAKQASAGLSDAFQQVGKDFAVVEAARNKVRNFRQTNEAEAYAFEKLNELKSIASEDQDFDSANYEVQIDKIGSEAAKTITSQFEKDQFLSNYQKQGIATKWGIKNLFREKELEATKASVEYSRQQIVNGYAGMSPAEKVTAVSTFKQMLVNGVKVGLYTKDVAHMIDAKFQEDVQKSVVDTHIIANPKTTITGLKEGKDGPYPGISDQFRAESIVKAEAYDKKYAAEAETEQKKKIDTNENDIVTRMIDPQKQKPTEGELINLMNAGEVSPKFAKAAIDNVRSAKKYKSEKERSSVFNKLAEDILSPNKKENEIRDNLLNKNAIGELNDDEFKTLYTFFQSVTKKEVEEAMPQKTWLQRLFNNGKDKGLRQEVMTGMFKQYMQKVNSGINPDKAVSAIINTHLDNHLAEEARKPARQYANNPATKTRAYSEDGGENWYDEKTKELIK